MTYNPGPQRNVTKLNGATRISSHHLCCEWRSDNQGDAFTGFGAVASRWNASLHAALSWGRTLEECIDGCQTLPGCTFASHEHAHGTCRLCYACQLRAHPGNWTSWAMAGGRGFRRREPVVGDLLNGQAMQHYSESLYGTRGALPPMGSLRILWTSLLPLSVRQAISSVGLCTGKGGFGDQPFMAPLQYPGQSSAIFLHRPTVVEDLSAGVPSYGWAEIVHCRNKASKTWSAWKMDPLWAYVTPGSGVSVNVGRTRIVSHYTEATRLLQLVFPGLVSSCPNSTQESRRPLDLSAAREESRALEGLDSIQIVAHKEWTSQEPLHELVMLHLWECQPLTPATPGLMCGWPRRSCAADSEPLRQMDALCHMRRERGVKASWVAQPAYCRSSECYADDAGGFFCPSDEASIAVS